MNIMKAIPAYGNKFALVIGRSRRFSKPLHLSTPQDIFFPMAHTLYVWLDFFVSLYRYTLEVLISLYVFIAIFQSPLRIGSIINQPAKYFMLECLSLSCIQGCRFLSGLE